MFQRHWKNFKQIMQAVRRAQEKFQTGDASPSNGGQKIWNDRPFERLTKIFEWMLPAVRTGNEKFQTGDASKRSKK